MCRERVTGRPAGGAARALMGRASECRTAKGALRRLGPGRGLCPREGTLGLRYCASSQTTEVAEMPPLQPHVRLVGASPGLAFPAGQRFMSQL